MHRVGARLEQQHDLAGQALPRGDQLGDAVGHQPHLARAPVLLVVVEAALVGQEQLDPSVGGRCGVNGARDASSGE